VSRFRTVLVKNLFLLGFLYSSLSTLGQEIVEFEGIPSKKVERTTDFSNSTIVSGLESQSAAVRISKSGENYFWTSRNSIPMRKVEDGIYITYWAIDGTGYVRTLTSAARKVYQRQAVDNQVGQTMYVEHILIGLESITYYGR
jgi:hypothetical protein